MSDAIVTKLNSSFDELDRCIAVTKEVLSKKPGLSEAVLSRVEQYSEIVSKQRRLAVDLRERIAQHDWHEVTRIVKIINGLSSMIRDDAQAILSGATEASASTNDAGVGAKPC